MISGKLKGSLLLLILALSFSVAAGQGNVAPGIHYQAVARDNYGKELVNEKIDVRFSIISGSPDGVISYMEVHSTVVTSKFGVFSLVIGKGINAGGKFSELSQVEWSTALHFLKVEVKFENDFVDMGTMQFLAVPYALFAQKSLEPGPPGPKGDQGPQGLPGDPASDNQTLSFDGSNLSISGGNKLTLNDLLQNLTVSYQPDGTYLGISRGNSVKLANIESDGDPKNEIQDITITSDKLKITNNAEAREWDLTRYLDNTDNQVLTWDPVTRRLGLSGSTGVIDISELKDDADANPVNEIQDLTWDASRREIRISGDDPVSLAELKDDADADPANEIQSLIRIPSKPRIGLGKDTVTVSINDADADPGNELQELSYNKTTGNLSITGKNPVNLNNTIGFKARKTTSETGLLQLRTYPFINSETEFIDGEYNSLPCYNNTQGIFTAPVTGIYTFFVSYKADGIGSGRILTILKNANEYEILGPDIVAGSELVKWITMKLNSGDIVSLSVNTGTSTNSGTGSFVGYRVN